MESGGEADRHRNRADNFFGGVIFSLLGEAFSGLSPPPTLPYLRHVHVPYGFVVTLVLVFATYRPLSLS